MRSYGVCGQIKRPLPRNELVGLVSGIINIHEDSPENPFPVFAAWVYAGRLSDLGDMLGFVNVPVES